MEYTANTGSIPPAAKPPAKVTACSSVEAAGNMLVIKCMTGMAQAVCASMDAMHWQNFVGTLAGEDTIFIVCRTDAAAQDAQEEFRKLMGR